MPSSIRREINHGSLDQSSDCAQPDHERDLTSTRLPHDHDSREKTAPLALSRRAAHKIYSTDLASLPELIHQREQKQANDGTLPVMGLFSPSARICTCQFRVGRASRLIERCSATKCRSESFIELLSGVRRRSFPVPHVIPSVGAVLPRGRRKARSLAHHERSGGGLLPPRFSNAIACRPS